MSDANKTQIGGTHYTDMELQPWDVLQSVLTRDEFIGYLKGNIVKYALRQGKKDSDDVRKAKHYMQKLEEMK